MAEFMTEFEKLAETNDDVKLVFRAVKTTLDIYHFEQRFSEAAPKAESGAIHHLMRGVRVAVLGKGEGGTSGSRLPLEKGDVIAQRLDKFFDEIRPRASNGQVYAHIPKAARRLLPAWRAEKDKAALSSPLPNSSPSSLIPLSSPAPTVSKLQGFPAQMVNALLSIETRLGVRVEDWGTTWAKSNAQHPAAPAWSLALEDAFAVQRTHALNCLYTPPKGKTFSCAFSITARIVYVSRACVNPFLL
jgi:hypothetical protein